MGNTSLNGEEEFSIAMRGDAILIKGQVFSIAMWAIQV